MRDILLSAGLVLVFIMVGGLFAAAEMALISLRDSQVRGLASKSRRGAKVARLSANPNRFLAAGQIGVTLAGFLSAAFGEATLSKHLEPVLRRHGMSAGLANVVSLVIITMIISYFALVFGELAPKRLALQRAEGIAQFVAGPLDTIASITRPVIWLLSRSTNVVVRALGGDPGTSRTSITEEELRGLVAAHESLDTDERRLIDEVFAAGERQVREVMVPRTEVDFLEGGTTVSRAAKIAASNAHSRYPVIGQSQDDVLGFVHIRDLLVPGVDRSRTVRDVMREVKRLPGVKKVLSALSEMRREGHHLAIVVDEYGGTAGIVTLEDLIEEVIGDIRDEYDEPSRQRVGTPDKQEVDGLLNLDDFAEQTGVELPDGPYETAAGYVMATLGDLPKTGDQVEVDGHVITVSELDGRRVARLRVTPAPEHAPVEHPASSPEHESSRASTGG
jgi:putative hemolysin